MHAMLHECLISLINQRSPASDFDVLVLDNSHKIADTLNYMRCKALCKLHGYRYVEEVTDGLSGARNRCIELTDTELIHYIDDDAVVRPWFTHNILKLYNNHPDCMATGGKVHLDWRLVDRPVWLPEGCGQEALLSKIDFGNKILEYKTKGQPVQWLAGANFGFRRCVVEVVGKFDTNLGRKGNTNSLLGQEENVYLKDIKRKVGRVLYSPKIIVRHIIQPERARPEWFYKRACWQAVGDILSNDLYMNGMKKAGKDHIKKYLHTLLVPDDPRTPQEFRERLLAFKYLSFHSLFSGDIRKL